MNTHRFATIVAFTLAATGCAASAPPDESESAAQALADNGGGTGAQGYTCTESGYCQCNGLEDCDNMFQVCKSHTYCNQDKQGLRCCCWNFATKTTSGATRRPGLGGSASRLP